MVEDSMEVAVASIKAQIRVVKNLFFEADSLPESNLAKNTLQEEWFSKVVLLAKDLADFAAQHEDGWMEDFDSFEFGICEDKANRFVAFAHSNCKKWHDVKGLMIAEEDEEFTCVICEWTKGWLWTVQSEKYEKFRDVILDCCTLCGDEYIRMAFMKEAKEYANEKCRLTAIPHRFDPEYEWSVTPEEYAAGDKECYTENSVATMNRHQCTNYDQLIASLDRDDPMDRAYYCAIYDRCEQLVNDYLGIPYNSLDGLSNSTWF